MNIPKLALLVVSIATSTWSQGGIYNSPGSVWKPRVTSPSYFLPGRLYSDWPSVPIKVAVPDSFRWVEMNLAEGKTIAGLSHGPSVLIDPRGVAVFPRDSYWRQDYIESFNENQASDPHASFFQVFPSFIQPVPAGFHIKGTSGKWLRLDALPQRHRYVEIDRRAGERVSMAIRSPHTVAAYISQQTVSDQLLILNKYEARLPTDTLKWIGTEQTLSTRTDVLDSTGLYWMNYSLPSYWAEGSKVEFCLQNTSVDSFCLEFVQHSGATETSYSQDQAPVLPSLIRVQSSESRIWREGTDTDHVVIEFMNYEVAGTDDRHHSISGQVVLFVDGQVAINYMDRSLTPDRSWYPPSDENQYLVRNLGQYAKYKTERLVLAPHSERDAVLFDPNVGLRNGWVWKQFEELGEDKPCQSMTVETDLQGGFLHAEIQPSVWDGFTQSCDEPTPNKSIPGGVLGNDGTRENFLMYGYDSLVLTFRKSDTRLTADQPFYLWWFEEGLQGEPSTSGLPTVKTSIGPGASTGEWQRVSMDGRNFPGATVLGTSNGYSNSSRYKAIMMGSNGYIPDSLSTPINAIKFNAMLYGVDGQVGQKVKFDIREAVLTARQPASLWMDPLSGKGNIKVQVTDPLHQRMLVRVHKDNGRPYSTIVTDESGIVNLGDIPAGVYYVSLALPSGVDGVPKADTVVFDGSPVTHISNFVLKYRTPLVKEEGIGIKTNVGSSSVRTDLDWYVVDPYFDDARLTWKLLPAQAFPCGVSIDPISRSLVVSPQAVTAAATFTVRMQVTNPVGLSDTIEAHVELVKLPQPPSWKDPSPAWTTTVDQPLKVDLSSVLKDEGGLNNLVIADVTDPEQKVLGVSIDAATGWLTLVPPSHETGEFAVRLKATNAAAKSSEHVFWLAVRLPGFQAWAGQIQQVRGGGVQATWQAGFATSDPVVTKGRIYLAQGVVGTAPTSISGLPYVEGVTSVGVPAKLGPDGFVNGSYTTEFPANAVVRASNGSSLGTLSAYWKSAVAMSCIVQLSQDGKGQILVLGSLTPNFSGSHAAVIAKMADYLQTDSRHRAPRVSVSWSYSRAISSQVLTYWAVDDPTTLKSVVLSLDQRTLILDSLQDSREYKARVTSLDPNGIEAFGEARLLTPSGFNQITLELNDTRLPNVVGTVKILRNDTLVNTVPLSASNGGSYVFSDLVNGRYSIRTQSDNYAVSPAQIDFQLLRSDKSFSASFNTIPALSAGALRIRQEEGTGDLLVRIQPDQVQPGEVPAFLGLNWTNSDDVTDQVEIPLDGKWTPDALGGFKGWKIRLPRAYVLESVVAGHPSFVGDIQYLGSTFVTSLVKDDYNYPRFRTSTWSWPLNGAFSPQKYDTLGHPFILQQTIGNDTAQFQVSAGTADLGPVLRYKLLDVTTGQTVDSSHISTMPLQLNLPKATMVLPMWKFATARSARDGKEWMSGRDGSAGTQLSEAFESGQTSASFSLHTPEAGTWNIAAYVEVGPKNSSIGWAYGEDFGSSSLTGSKGWVKLGKYTTQDSVSGDLTVFLPVGVRVKIFAISKCEGFWFIQSCAEPVPDLAKADSRSGTGIISFANLRSHSPYQLSVSSIDRHGNTSAVSTFDFTTNDTSLNSKTIVDQLDSSGALRLRVPSASFRSREVVREIWVDPSTAIKRRYHSIKPDSSSISSGELTLLANRSSIPALLRSDAAFSGSARWNYAQLVGEEPDTSYRSVPQFDWRNMRVSWVQVMDVNTKRYLHQFTWPATEGIVSAQEFRAPSAATFTVSKTSTDSVYFNLSGLNGRSSGDQLRGAASVIFTPGIRCDLRTVMKVPYGSSFVPGTNEWIYAQPSFQGAWASRTDSLSSTTGHFQWLDEPAGGGLFYPAVAGAEFLPNEPDAPSMTMAIQLTEAQAAKGPWSLWLMPQSTNNLQRSKLYVRLDGAVPEGDRLNDGLVSDLYPASGSNPSWMKARFNLNLHAGRNLVQLVMGVSGTGVKGIALRPVAGTTDPDESASLPRFGGVGFSADTALGGFAPGQTINVQVVSVDRKGNASDTVTSSFQTGAPTDPVPSLRILPDTSKLKNGWLTGNSGDFQIKLDTGAAAKGWHVEVELQRLLSINPPAPLPQTPSQIGTGDSWLVQLSSLQGNYPPYPGDSGYALYARPVSASGNGPWTRYRFGVLGNANAVSFQLRDSVYTAHGLDFAVRYAYPINGVQNQAVGDWEIKNLQLDSTAQWNHTRLYLRQARATLSSTVNDGIHFISVTSLDGGFLEARSCTDDKDDDGVTVVQYCEPLTDIPVRYGRYRLHLDPTTAQWRDLSHPGQSNQGFTWPTAKIEDDEGNLARTTQINLTSEGVTSSFQANEDAFLLKDFATGSMSGDGFDLVSCHTGFSRVLANGSMNYSMSVQGCSDPITGPTLQFSTWDPWGQGSPSLLDPLPYTGTVRYSICQTNCTTDPAPADPTQVSPYRITSNGVQQMVFAAGKEVKVNGWNLRINKYTFSDAGVVLDDFDVQMPDWAVVRPAGAPSVWLKHFSGLKVAGDTTLSFRSLAQMSGPQTLVLNPGWKVAAPSLQFGFVADHEDEGLVLYAPTGTENRIPNGAASIFRTRKGLTTQLDTFRLAVSEFRMRPTRFTAFASSLANFNGQVGKLKVTGTLQAGFSDLGYSAAIDGLSIKSIAGTGSLLSSPNLVSGKEIQIQSPQLVLTPDLGVRMADGTLDIKSGQNLIVVKPANPTIKGWSPIDLSGSDFRLVPGNKDILLKLESPQVSLDKTYLPSGVNLGTSQSTVYELLLNSEGDIVGASGAFDLAPDGRSYSLPLEGLGTVTMNKVQFGATWGEGDADRSFWLASKAMLRFDQSSFLSDVGVDLSKIRVAMVQKAVATPATNAGGASSESSVSTSQDPGAEFRLDTLDASVKGWNRKIGIAPSDFYSKLSPEKMLEISTDGVPLRAWYYRGEKPESKFHIATGHWNFRFTEAFPITGLQGVLVRLDTLQMAWNQQNKKMELEALRVSGHAEWDKLPLFGKYVELLPAKAEEGQDPGKVTLDMYNPTTPGGITTIHLAAARIRINNDTFNLSDCNKSGTGAKVPAYLDISLDGNVAGGACFDSLVAPIYPLGERSDADGKLKKPDVWAEGKNVTIVFKGGALILSGKSFTIRSKPLNLYKEDTASLNARTEDFEMSIDRNGFHVHKLQFTQKVDKKLNFTGIELKVNAIDVAYASVGDKLTVTLNNSLAFPGGVGCKSFDKEPTDWTNIASIRASTLKDGMDAGVNVSFSKPLTATDDIKFDWAVKLSAGCELASIDAYIKNLTIDKDGIVAEDLVVDVGSVFKELLSSVPVDLNGDGWVDGANLGWVYGAGMTTGQWSVHGDLKSGFDLDVLGATVSGKVHYLDLFKSNRPGVTISGIEVKLPKALGGRTIPSNMDVFVNGKYPYLHPRANFREIPFGVPPIEITDEVSFGGAEMTIKYLPKPDGETGDWIFTGIASVSIPGFCDGMIAQLVMSRDPVLRKAKLSIDFGKAAIPIGTTGLFMTGLMGAYYDGPEQPACMSGCRVPPLKSPKKMELVAYIQASDPSVLNGQAGFWIELESLGFGVDGKLKLIRGIADAHACAALYNSGRNFHGQIDVVVDQRARIEGGFYVDIWVDRRGKNIAAEANAGVGLSRGAIIKTRWFKLPRRSNIIGNFMTRFGRFQNGSNGFVTGVRAFGRSFGVGLINGSFRLGSVGGYKLATPGNAGGGTDYDPKQYNVYDLNLDKTLRGGEQLTIMAANSNDNDWDGLDMFLASDQKASDGTVLRTTVEEDLDSGMNIHTLTFRNPHGNPSGTKPLFLWVPARTAAEAATTTDPGESSGNPGDDNGGSGSTSSDLTSGSLSGKNDEFTLLADLLPPTATGLKIEKTNDSLLFTGTIQGFERSIRNMSIAPRTTSGTPVTPQLVLSQKHRFHLALRDVRLTRAPGNIGLRRIDLTEFVGWDDPKVKPLVENGTASLANFNFATYDSTARTLSFTTGNPCIWKPAGWRAGDYQVHVVVDKIDFMQPDGNGGMTSIDPKNEGEALEIPDTSFALQNADGSPFVIQLKATTTIPRPQNLSATGSTWASNNQGKNETRRVFVDWVHDPASPASAYKVQWRGLEPESQKWYSNTVGTNGHFEWTPPPAPNGTVTTCPIVTTLAKDTIPDSQYPTSDTASVCVPTGDKSLVDQSLFGSKFEFRVTPMVGHDTVKIVNGDTAWADTGRTVPTIFTKLELIDTASLTVQATIGQRVSTVATRNLASFAVPTATVALVPRNRDTTLNVQLDITSLDTAASAGSSGTPDRYLLLDVQLLTKSGVKIADTVVWMPSLRVGTDRVHLKSTTTFPIPVHFAPRNDRQTCKEAYPFAHVFDTTLMKQDTARPYVSGRLPEDMPPCFGDSTLMVTDYTPRDTFVIRVGVLNEGWRGETTRMPTVDLKVKVMPPMPSIDKVSTPYLLAGRIQDLDLDISGISNETGASTVLRLLDSLGTPVAWTDSSNVALPLTGIVLTKADSVFHKVIKLPIGLPRQTMKLVALTTMTGDTVKSSSGIVFEDDPAASECVDQLSMTRLDGFLMQPIGFFPRRKVAKNGTVELLFSELHNQRHLPWRAWACIGSTGNCVRPSILRADGSNLDSTKWVPVAIADSMIKEDGLEIPVLAQAYAGDSLQIIVGLSPKPGTSPNVSSDCMRAWSTRYPLLVTAPRSLSILTKDTTFKLKGYLEGDRVTWRFGYDASLRTAQPEMARYNSDLGWITAPRTDWIYAQAVDGHGLDTARLLIPFVRPTKIRFLNDLTEVSPNSEVVRLAPGTTIQVDAPVQGPNLPGTSIQQIWYAFGSDPWALYAGPISMGNSGSGNLRVKVVHRLSKPTPGGRDTLIDGTMRTLRYTVGLPEGVTAQFITFPAERIQAHARVPLVSYPLFFHLNPEDLVLGANESFEVRAASGRALDFEMRSVRGGWDVWVGLDTLYPDRDQKLQLWHGAKNIRTPSTTGIWNGYTGVWHLDDWSAGGDANVAYSSDLPYLMTGTPDTLALLGGKAGSGVLKAQHASMDVQSTHVPGLTLSGWARLRDPQLAPDSGLWVMRRGNPHSDGMGIRLMRNGALGVMVAGQSAQSAPRAIDTAMWTHLGATWSDGGNAQVHLVVNGVELAHVLVGSRSIRIDTADLLAGDGAFQMDELRFSRAPLGVDWLSMDWASQRRRSDLRIPVPTRTSTVRVQKLSGTGASQVVAPWTGDRLLEDREDTLVGLPLPLQGGTMLRTSAGLRGDTTSPALQFTTDVACHAILAVPAGGIPSFANGWAHEGNMTIEGGKALELRGKELARGDHYLPGTAQGSDSAQGYALFLVPARVPAGAEDGLSSSDSLHRIDSLVEGSVLPNGDTIVQVGNPGVSGLPFYIPSGTAPVTLVPGGTYDVYVKGKTCPEGQLASGTLVVRTSQGTTDTLIECVIRPTVPVTVQASYFGQISGPVNILRPDQISGGTIFHPAAGQALDPNDSSTVITQVWTGVSTAYRSDTLSNGLPGNMRIIIDQPTLITVYLVDGRHPSLDIGGDWSYAGPVTVLKSGQVVISYTKVFHSGDTVVIPGAIVPDDRGLSQVVFVTGTAVPRGVLGWKAQELMVRGLGGDRSTSSNAWNMTNLDVQFLAGEPLTSWSWKLAVRSVSGTRDGAQQVVLTLGKEEVGQVFTRTGELLEVIKTQSSRLSDLTVSGVNRDSVTVDIKTFRAVGRAMVVVRNQGAQALDSGYDMVLFEDRNADFVWQEGVDSLLGKVHLNPLEAHHDTLIQLPVNSILAFPDNALLAVVDPVAQVPDIDRNNNVGSSRSVCRNWNERIFQIDDNRGELRGAIPALNQRVPYGTPLQGVRWRDTDHDGRIGALDSLDAMAVLDRQLTVWNGVSGAVMLTLPATDLGQVRVDDLDGDVVPEFVIGNTVWGSDGIADWGASASGWKQPTVPVDLDGDGLFDTAHVDGTCMSVNSGATGLALWASDGCASGWPSSFLSSVRVSRGSCFDAGVWPLVGASYGIQVRVANPGTASVPAGTTVLVERLASGHVEETWSIGLPRSLRSGEWVDLEVGQGRNVLPQSLRVRVKLGTVGRMDRNPSNDQTTFPTDGGNTP